MTEIGPVAVLCLQVICIRADDSNFQAGRGQRQKVVVIFQQDKAFLCQRKVNGTVRRAGNLPLRPSLFPIVKEAKAEFHR